MNPSDLVYSEEHEWVRVESDGIAAVGITEFAAGELGDVVFVELPELDSEVTQFGQFGEVESVKAVSELYSPVSGKVVERNESVVEKPELVNESPFESGWLVKVALSDLAELDKLRITFRRKAFQRRQELLLRRLQKTGLSPEQLCHMRMAELAKLQFDDSETVALRERYMEIRGEFGGPEGDGDLAFANDEGAALKPETFAEYIKDLRRVRVNAEFNANLCRGMLQTRYGETSEQ